MKLCKYRVEWLKYGVIPLWPIGLYVSNAYQSELKHYAVYYITLTL